MLLLLPGLISADNASVLLNVDATVEADERTLEKPDCGQHT
jgi:hypothetical protein